MDLYGYQSEFDRKPTVLARLKPKTPAMPKLTLPSVPTGSQMLSGAKKALPAGGTALAAGLEALNASRDINTEGMSTVDQLQRGAESGSRLALSAAGAKLGSTLLGFTPVTKLAGAAVGGGMGYFAPETARDVLNYFGADVNLPSDRAAMLRETMGKNPLAGQQKSNPLALLPNETAVDGVDAPAQLINNTPPAKKQEPDKFQAQLGNTLEPAKDGFNPVDVNANSQEMVMQALNDLRENLKNPAKAKTLGGAFAQKLENKQLTDKATATAKAADQLNDLATGSVNIRAGEQKMKGTDAEINQTIQGLQKGENELDMQRKLKQASDAFAQLNDQNDPDGKRRRALQTILLTLQGKEPKAEFDFMEVGGGTDASGMPLAKQLAVVNNRTGEVSLQGGAEQQTAMATPKDGQVMVRNNVKYIYDEKLGGYKPA